MLVQLQQKENMDSCKKSKSHVKYFQASSSNFEFKVKLTVTPLEMLFAVRNIMWCGVLFRASKVFASKIFLHAFHNVYFSVSTSVSPYS